MITLWMACFFLGGSIFLPLGDFSLLRDIPAMYHSYSKIASPEELGVLDFVGDYLLHGKDLFGHNEHDKPQSESNNVQFRHQANPLTVVFQALSISALYVPELPKRHQVQNKIIALTDYQEKLLRPPLS